MLFLFFACSFVVVVVAGLLFRNGIREERWKGRETKGKIHGR